MGKKLALKWITDVIGEDYKNWSQGDYVIIDAQTGCGKTYFILNKLLNNISKNDSILYICNRTNLKRQIKVDLLKHYGLYKDDMKLDTIDKIKWIQNVRVTSYHELFFNNINQIYDSEDNRFELNKPRYMILDECQFLFEDASFCNKIQYTYKNLISEYQPFTTKIFLSSTMQEIKNKIIDNFNLGNAPASKLRIYNTGRDYSYLNIKYFKKLGNIVNLIHNDKTDDKWLIFVSSIQKGIEMQKQLGNDISIFVQARDKITNKFNDIVKDCKFKQKVFITTKVLENGINIKDDKLKNLVVMTYDQTSFIQEIGRKRININDAPIVNIYIPTRQYKTFRSLNKTYEDKLKEVKLFKDDPVEFNKKYDNDLKLFKKNNLNELFYKDKFTKEFKINEIGLHRLKIDKKFAIKMMHILKKDEFGYIKEQLDWLNLGYTFNENELIEDIILDIELENLIKFLNSLVGEQLFKKERKELIDKINLRDNRGRQQKSISLINAYFKENKIPFIIDRDRDNKEKLDDGQKNLNFRKTYWIIGEINYKKK